MKVAELRDMSDEQLALTLKDACESLFRLRIQAQTERLDAPSELRRKPRLLVLPIGVHTPSCQRASSAPSVYSARPRCQALRRLPFPCRRTQHLLRSARPAP